MKKILSCIAILLMLASVFSLTGCIDPGGTGGGGGGDDEFPVIDNSVDLNVYIPTPDDGLEEGETYYTSTSLDLVTEINGNYTTDRPFVLDSEDESLRIYRGLYLYVGDFVQVLYYKVHGDIGALYVIMSDETDTAYVEMEYSTGGSPLQMNIIEEGIYDLILDTDTLGVDFVRVGDIDTPVYETVRSCELYVHLSQTESSYTVMTLDTDTGEYWVEQDIPMNAGIGFFSASHMARYKVTLGAPANNTLVWWDFANPERIRVHVGGRYRVYFHSSTYVVRMELITPDTYYCQVEWDQGNVLTAVAGSPHLFAYEFEAIGKPNDPYVEIPSFYPMLGMSYDLSVIDADGYVFADTYVTEPGTYKLTVNLIDFTVTVEKLP